MLSYFFIPSVKQLMNNIFTMFASGDFTVVREFVAAYGPYAMLVSAALMIFQSVAAPLPATIVYSYVGGMLTGGARLFVTGLLILFALSVLIALLRQIYNEKRKNKKEVLSNEEGI